MVPKRKVSRDPPSSPWTDSDPRAQQRTVIAPIRPVINCIRCLNISVKVTLRALIDWGSAFWGIWYYLMWNSITVRKVPCLPITFNLLIHATVYFKPCGRSSYGLDRRFSPFFFPSLSPRNISRKIDQRRCLALLNWTLSTASQVLCVSAQQGQKLTAVLIWKSLESLT